jgi:hypothetical protein
VLSRSSFKYEPAGELAIGFFEHPAQLTNQGVEFQQNVKASKTLQGTLGPRMYLQCWEVEQAWGGPLLGFRPFPIDMLRYERCFPFREVEDSKAICDSIREDLEEEPRENPDRPPRRVQVARWTDRKNLMPNVERWESFG